MAEVAYHRASRIYPGSDYPAVNELSLDVASGELLVLVGPSGSGKSSALRLLAGLEPVDAGSIHIDGRDVTNLEPQKRDIAMVFQNYALYPQMTVAENMAFALKQKKVPKAERRAKVEEAARILDLEPYLDRKPKNLSGGQRQRVAMGRAIVRQPKVFLMDEPLSNLDAKLRVQTRAELSDLQARLGVTTVYVTHDQIEAMTMGHRVAVLKDGILQQVDAPKTLYHRPVNRFVASFIGSPAMNLVTVEREGNQLQLANLKMAQIPEIARSLQTNASRNFTVGIRPEHLRLASDGIPGEVKLAEELGSESYVHIDVNHKNTVARMVVRTTGDANVGRGDNVKVAVNGPVHLFGEDGMRVEP